MKSKKRKEQFELADTLFEMGLDYEIVETISGVSASELLLHKINLIEFDKDKKKKKNK